VGILYVHPITHAVGCRTCLGLEYRKRRFKGMAELRHNQTAKSEIFIIIHYK
jgi:hypothetical protein